ncbi:MAG: hypothetical protein H7Y38_03925 [Armatimonadetes bacterium]|nr:hypothetical protein [Armatimonadota bacterium]
MYARSNAAGIWGTPSASPLTMGVIVTVAVFYFLELARVPVEAWLAFNPLTFPATFWTPLTWFLVPDGGNPLSFLFSLGWFYLFAGSVERAYGTRDFGTILLTLSVTMALLAWGGFAAFHTGGFLLGLTAIMGPLMIAWAMINKGETLTFFFLPIPAAVFGVIGVAMTWYGGGGGLGGLYLLPVCAAMYWYVTRGRYSPDYDYRNRNPRLRFDEPDMPTGFSGRRTGIEGRRTERNLDDSPTPRPFNILHWWRERQEKKRLEEIFRRSGFTDEDDR